MSDLKTVIYSFLFALGLLSLILPCLTPVYDETPADAIYIHNIYARQHGLLSVR